MDTKSFTTGKRKWQSNKPKWRKVPGYELSLGFDVAVVLLLLIAFVSYLLA